MSLLNDALRAAEQRQNRPDVASAYTGRVEAGASSRRWLIPVIAVGLGLAVAGGGYALWFEQGGSNQVVTEPAPPTTPEPAPEQAAPVAMTPAPKPEPRAPASTVIPEPVDSSVAEPQPEAAAPSSSELEPEPVPSAPESEVTATALTAPEERAEPQAPAPGVAQREQPPEVPAVKQVRETPEALDRQVSREVSQLLRRGESRLAEARLAELASGQAAPASRAVFARAMLLQDSPERALRWVTGPDAEAVPDLRLLQARALLALGRQEQAVTLLVQDVPAVRDHLEYRITLATLLQQTGQNVEAARHWSALIAVDDRRPAWWVGLAIALESQGEPAAAVKAYAQAAQLPGLSPSLTHYVRDRLNSLQAG